MMMTIHFIMKHLYCRNNVRGSTLAIIVEENTS